MMFHQKNGKPKRKRVTKTMNNRTADKPNVNVQSERLRLIAELAEEESRNKSRNGGKHVKLCDIKPKEEGYNMEKNAIDEMTQKFLELESQALAYYTQRTEMMLSEEKPAETSVSKLLESLLDFFPRSEYSKFFRDICKKYYDMYPETILNSLALYADVAKELTDEPERILVEDVLPTRDMLLVVFFNDGEVKELNVRALIDEHPEFAELEDRELFRKVTVEPCGYGISWNDRLSCSETELYENGESIAYVPEEDWEIQAEPAVMTANCRKTFAVNPDKAKEFLDVAGNKEQQEKNDKVLSGITISRNEKE